MLVLTTALKFAKEWFQHQQEKQMLEREKLQAELQFLKSQINPHFLFNTLNNLYALTLKKSDSAPELVLKLSEMMRYMLYNSNEKMVPMELEINYLKNYIDLEKIRKMESTRITVDIDENVEGKEIAPLLFIPFLENSFKHGVNNNIDAGWIEVKLQIEGDGLSFTVANNKPRNPKINGKDHGIGLKNVKRRLDLLYPEKHELQIEDTPEFYRTHLKIILK
jgi:LytS/YehU family sensor histidine kinase